MPPVHYDAKCEKNPIGGESQKEIREPVRRQLLRFGSRGEKIGEKNQEPPRKGQTFGPIARGGMEKGRVWPVTRKK